MVSRNRLKRDGHQGPDKDGGRLCEASPGPLERGLSRSGRNVPRSILGPARVAQQKMAQGMSAWAVQADGRPMEHPAENLHTLGLALLGRVALGRPLAVQVEVALTILGQAVDP